MLANLIVSTLLMLLPAGDAAVPLPASIDPQLEVRLVAQEPTIVTPTSLAVAPNGMIYAIECLTHFRPDDYEGPEADRILVFSDLADKDAKPSVFFEGTTATMGIVFDFDGSLVVSTRDEIFRLRDTSGDGKADEKTTLIRMETTQKYPHNGLGSIAFDPRGNLYFGIGENLGSPYAIVGTDGSKVEGSNEGGRVFRCQGDGTEVELFAQGFWNPFAICFDTFGRLFVVDNDPDSRPPCRLIYVVPGGDYGFEFRHGRKGTSPFIAWDGELPGSLPMAAGTSEAPSGIIAYESALLPSSYLGDLIVTSWGDHRLERFELTPNGASFRMVGEPMIQGTRDFRPVGLAVAPSGALYFTDWVQRSYPIHGHGRIWELTAKGAKPNPLLPAAPSAQLADPRQSVRESAAMKLSGEGELGIEVLMSAVSDSSNPRSQAAALWGLSQTTAAQQACVFALKDDDANVRALALRLMPQPTEAVAEMARSDHSALVRAAALRRLNSEADIPTLFAAFAVSDPFIQQAARYALEQFGKPAELAEICRTAGPRVKENLLLVLRAQKYPEAVPLLTEALADRDARVRMVALEWALEENLTALRPVIEKELASGPPSPQWFNMSLEAIARLGSSSSDDPKNLKGAAEADQLAGKLLRDSNAQPVLRLLALRRLPSDAKSLTPKLLDELIHSSNQALAVGAVRALREGTDPNKFTTLEKLAADKSLPSPVRAEAVSALGLDTEAQAKSERQAVLLQLLADGDPSVRREAIRLSTECPWTAEHQKELDKLLASDGDFKTAWDQAKTKPTDRPPVTDTAAWSLRLNGVGDATSGERLFFSPKGPGCYRCHSIHEKGGNVGPSLTDIGRGMNHDKLLGSILEPSREMAPQWIPWVLLLDDGSIKTGVMLGEAGPKERYGDANGQVFYVEKNSIEERKAQAKSLMPENLVDQMSDADLRDLLLYLEGAYDEKVESGK